MRYSASAEMAEARYKNGLQELIGEVLALCRFEAEPPSVEQAEEGLRVLTSLDYSRLLRRLFDRQEVSEIYREFSKALPELNSQVIRERAPQRLARIATDLGAGLNATPFAPDGGTGLRGFYVRQGDGIKRPLIYLNTADHPVVMASAFWHELGHHLTARLFDDQRSELRLSFTTNYHLHLNDPLEASADILPILVGYPKAQATRLFARSLRGGSPPNIDLLVAKLRSHLHSISKFEFDPRFSAIQNLRYLAAMIHCGKLRWALLSEFDI